MLGGSWLAGSGIAGAVKISVLTSLGKPSQRFPLRCQIFHSTGGTKKDFFIEQENNNFIGADFEDTLKGFGAGTFNYLAFDFPLDSDDQIVFSYNGTVIYRGLVDNLADPKGGSLKLVPFKQRYNETLYNGPFTTKTIEQIMDTIISSVASQTGISWNSSFIDTGSSDTFTIEYFDETITKIMDDLVSRLDDRFWGVNENNIFFVTSFSTSVDRLLLQNDKPIFTDVSVDRDFSKIKSTRTVVYRKVSGSNSGTKRVGRVGDDSGVYVPGSNYPTLELETVTRRKDTKLTVSEVLSDAESLDFAYTKLLAEAITPLSVTIKGVDIDSYIPKPFELVQVEDYPDTQLFTIESCDSITKFDSGFSLDNDEYVEGSGSVSFVGAASYPIDRQFDFGSIYRAYKITKIGFMIKSTKEGGFIEFSAGQTISGDGGTGPDGLEADGLDSDFSNDLWDTVFTVNIEAPNQWQYITIDWSDDFRYFGWRVNDTLTASDTVNIDRIQLLGFNKNTYESNVVNTKTSISRDGIVIDVKLNEIDLQANDSFFRFNSEIKRLESITKEV